MAEFRWILAALGVVLLICIWAWGSRRSRQAPGKAELREQTPSSAEAESRSYFPPLQPTVDDSATTARKPGESRERVIAHLEPLDIRTADFDARALFDEPMSAHADPIDVTLDLQYVATDVNEHTGGQASRAVERPSRKAPSATVPVATPVQAAPPPPIVPAAPPVENLERSAVTAAQVPNASELQRIVTIRVSASGDSRWPGQRLMNALEVLGLAFGRYNVYHRKHVDGRSLFCVASLVEPGTFDVSKMPTEEFRGVTLFAVLPGPLDPVQTLNALFETAGGLADELAGVIQDHKGVVMTASRAVALREELVQFQALLAS